jgi:DNA modification methylase
MKYPDDFINKIICGDCLEVMKDIPDLFNLILITDPPYGINYDPKWLSDMNIAKGSKPNKTDNKVINDSGEIDYNFLFQFKKRCIFGYPYIPDHNATGWIVWDKQPKVNGRGITTPVEIASTTLRKGYDIFHCMWAGYLRDLTILEHRFKHPTQKPLKLIKYIVETYTKETDIILDPFLGSGTTAVACKSLGRRYIGIEISKEYCDIARKRVNATPEPLFV